jgi:acyl carrier protein
MASTAAEIIEQLNPLFRDVLEDDAIQLSPATTANDIENWDSITNIQLIVAIEKKYKIRFTSREIQNFKNVGELVEALLSKTTAA